MTNPFSLSVQPPVARRCDQADVFFGTEVRDPYRWMEELESDELRGWLEGQNATARAALDGTRGREEVRSRLLELTNFERFSAPTVRSGRYVYAHNSGLQNQAVLWVQEGTGGEARVLLDPNTMVATGKEEPDGTVALGGVALSEDGERLLYAVAEAGSDWVTWRVREVATGKDLPDRVEWSKFSAASWMPDGSGFLYSGYGMPEAKAGVVADGDPVAEVEEEPAEAAVVGNAMWGTNFFHKVYLHRIGTAQAEDVVVYERADDPELLLGGQVTEDGRYLLLSASKGHTNQLHVRALGVEGGAEGGGTDAERVAGGVGQEPRAIAPVADARYDPVETEGSRLWLHTTKGAPNGRVVLLDMESPTEDEWREVLPETAENLEAVSLVGGVLLATRLVDVQSRVLMHRPETGELLGEVELPGVGMAAGFTGRRTDTETFFTFTNFTTPPTVLRLRMDGGERPEVYRAPKLLFDPAAYETEQVWATSADGTRVPMFVSHRRGMRRDGENPTLLYGYGGFNISLLPHFSPGTLLGMERGGVYVQANLRGGGEYGERWHEAGTGVRKQNVFDDFTACAERLVELGYTRAERLAIEGGSNGGLLVAAAELQRPELFGAVVAHVGVMDMLRFPLFTIGYAWKSDYGDAAGNEAEFRALLRYSPVHNAERAARSGVPPTLVLTGDHDDRVFPGHSFKFVAAMQEALRGAEGGPVLLRVDLRAGHGAGKPLEKRVEEQVDVFGFLSETVGWGGA